MFRSVSSTLVGIYTWRSGKEREKSRTRIECHERGAGVSVKRAWSHRVSISILWDCGYLRSLWNRHISCVAPRRLCILNKSRRAAGRDSRPLTFKDDVETRSRARTRTSYKFSPTFAAPFVSPPAAQQRASIKVFNALFVDAALRRTCVSPITKIVERYATAGKSTRRYNLRGWNGERGCGNFQGNWKSDFTLPIHQIFFARAVAQVE